MNCFTWLRLYLSIHWFIVSYAYPSYKFLIPNGYNVINPFDNSTRWSAVGHTCPDLDADLNPFGKDFKAAKLTWTYDLCSKDSDGDGRTNGEELGDPHCEWKDDGAPKYTQGVSHPGFNEKSLPHFDNQLCEEDY